MSTGSHFDPTTNPSPLHARHFPVSGKAAGAEAAEGQSIDPELIRDTRNQIRGLVDEITALAQSESSKRAFCEGFLTRVVQALAAVGGAVWLRSESDGTFALEYQVNLAQSGLTRDTEQQTAHGTLLARVAEANTPKLIPPRSGDSDASDNPTDCLLVVAPLVVEQEVVGLVEIFQRADAGPTTQRGYLRFLVQMAGLASDFLRNDRLRHYAVHQSHWQRIGEFVAAVHAGLDIRETVHAIANEARRVLECERVSVAVRRGAQMEIRAISGLDSIERRADQVKSLSRLASAVARGGESLWYDGDDSGLPPQIEKHLHAYLDVSHTRLLVIEPLYRSSEAEANDTGRRREPAEGALILEQLGSNAVPDGFAERLPILKRHSARALANSLDHSSIFLAPVLTRVGQSPLTETVRRLPRLGMVALAMLLAFAALWLVPWPFSLRADGQLKPAERAEVYASVDGVLQDLRVPDDPDTVVQAGDVVAVMSNNGLMVEIRNLQGQLAQAREESKKLQRMLARPSEMTTLDRGIIDGDLAEANELQASLERQLQLKMQEQQLLNVVAPATGRIINWQLRQNLLRRPVQRGQNLMTIVPPDTAWEIELQLPEKRVAHLMQAFENAGTRELKVTFTLASHPGQEYTGNVVSMDNKMDVRGEDGNAVLLRVAFDSADVPAELLRTNTRVMAQIHAGQRSLGYVWFHDIAETIQSKWILWF